MNEQIKQIAERLAGLRDALEITPEEMAKVCNLTPEQYMKLESGTVDILSLAKEKVLPWNGLKHTNTNRLPPGLSVGKQIRSWLPSIRLQTGHRFI